MPLQITANITVVGDDDQNVFLATAEVGDLAAVGYAKRAPGDRRDGGFGVDLAVQRALAKLAEQLGEINDAKLASIVAREERDKAERKRKREQTVRERYRHDVNVSNPGRTAIRKESGRERYERAHNWSATHVFETTNAEDGQNGKSAALTGGELAEVFEAVSAEEVSTVTVATGQGFSLDFSADAPPGPVEPKGCGERGERRQQFTTWDEVLRKLGSRKAR